MDCFNSVRHRSFFLLLCLCLPFLGFAQPVNDNCSNAVPITISSGGFGLGTFTSGNYDISLATVQTGETFAPAIFVAGQSQKSIWYKFTLPTTRSVTVRLTQPGTAIAAGDAGFAVYKTNGCLPTTALLSTKLTPIATFGYTYHPCVDAGDYLVQVSSKNAANGLLGIQLDISDVTGAVYDHPAQAYDFGVLSTPVSKVDFAVDCQSLEDATEVCTSLHNYQQYTKSTWHTFTTPAYFDYLTVELTSSNGNCSFTNGTAVFGYNLYTGNAKTTAISSLSVADGCDSLVTNGQYADKRIYTCGALQPNTTYSIQLFYNQNFNDNMRLVVSYEGVKPTQAPQPILSGIPASNALGTLTPTQTGLTVTGKDYFACNSRHSVSSCGPSLSLTPTRAAGYSYNYDLSTFFTFTLASEANITLQASNPNSYYAFSAPTPYMRLYSQGVTNTCSALDTGNIILTAVGNGKMTCLPPGNYTVQVMGSDSLQPYNYFYCGYIGITGYHLPVLSNLGQAVTFSMTLTSINAYNKYSLSTPNAYDSINTMKALQNGVLYTAKTDTFGCANTVMPAGPKCGSHEHKAVYREFTIGDANGDNIPDSGVVVLGNYLGNSSANNSSILYAGDAGALAIAQNVSGFPDSIKGLVPFTVCVQNPGCSNADVCLTPGTYTLVTMADSTYIGQSNTSTNIQFNIITTKHYSDITAQDMGSIIDSLGSSGGTRYSDIDYFSCKDNAVSINGFNPPVIYNKDTATKMIYRQFYLKNDAIVTISNYYSTYCDYAYSSEIALFTGKATDGLNTLNHIKVNGQDLSTGSLSTPTCNPLPAGWYTVICYASGPTYANPFQAADYPSVGGAVGKKQEISINVTIACPAPKYNTPLKAAIDSVTKAPFLLQWNPRIGSTAAYPITDTTYNLYTEPFNCSTDIPFPSFLKPCDNKVNRVAYYVFQINKESYVQINTQNLWGEVFSGDVRTDSAQYATLTPIQPCLQSYGHIELCRLQPGVYTLIIFAGDVNVSGGCGSVTPQVYIDAVGYSRFDHAINAYDFGVIPSDSAYHNGKVGDVNPLNAGRAPSHDFFYCTTGAQSTDPTQADCEVLLNPAIYNNPGTNNHLFDTDPGYYYAAKRNLWYSFVVDKPGNVIVKVDGKQKDKTSQYAFAVYQSDVNSSLPLSTLIANGQLDSTVAQGLSFIKTNLTGAYYCSGSNTVSFYVDPCSFATPVRYYVLVEIPSNYPGIPFGGMTPNGQVEVSVLLDSSFAIKPKYDHYYQADTIGLGLTAGIYYGHTDNYTCATADANDPMAQITSCAPKTLWYKFTVGETGYIRYRSNLNGKPINWGSDMYLFQQTIPGDSTTKGLTLLRNSSGFYDSVSHYWAQQCISPGTYYLVTTGCSMVDQDFQPVIWLTEQAGDFCSRPVVASLNGAGAIVASVMVDCHTIGTDYGEFGPNLTCPPGKKTTDYKSSWFRVDVTGSDTLDVTAYLVENTNATSTDINYRLMTGDCGAMQETSCVQDALTQNTYKCLAPGSYYIQVFTPVLKNNQPVTGTIDLHVSGVKHLDTCAPIPKCLGNANFIPQFNCTTDSSVRFVNYSTYGSSISYKWDFGNNGDTSTAVSPSYFYPVLATDQVYHAKLLVRNATCGAADSVTVDVKVPGRPHVNLGPDISSCRSDTSVLLNATSFAGATYAWWNGTTNPTVVAKNLGQYQYSVKVTYNGCIATDTINIFIDPIAKKPIQNYTVCAPDSVQLYDYNGYSTYSWNTGGNVYYIYAKSPGLYWVDMPYKGCTVRDSFNVASVSAIRPLGNDTAVCLSVTKPYQLNAYTSAASAYYWQDNSRSSYFNATKPGLYWVRIVIGNCSVTDSINLTDATPSKPVILGALKFCKGDSTLLDAGVGNTKYAWSTGDSTQTIYVKKAGSYYVTVYASPVCSAVSGTVQVVQNTPPVPKITGNKIICNADSIVLNAGAVYASYAWSTGDTTQTTKAGGTEKVVLKVTDNNGCAGFDSVQVNASAPPAVDTVNASICSGKAYTLPSGKLAKQSGTYRDTLYTKTGCDSIRTTLYLSVTSPLLTSKDTSICSGKTYTLPSGTVVSKAGLYKDTVRTAAGCDSLVSTINLAVYSPSLAAKNAAICSGQSYTLPSGRIVQTAGQYKDTLRYLSGCDSMIFTIQLSVSAPVANKALSATVCKGKIYTLPSGKTVSAAGLYTDTLRGVLGCDSIITAVTLSVQNPLLSTKNVSICPGSSYTMPSGLVLTKAGVYTDTLRSLAGCDSLVTTVNLNIPSVAYISTNNTICAGGHYVLPSGLSVSLAGVYKDTLRSVAGCDSIITTATIAVFKPVFANKAATLCAGGSYTLPSGKIVSQTGMYQDTLRSVQGCDSLVTTLNLIVSPAAVYSNKTAALCKGDIYVLPSGHTVSQPGYYTDTLRSKMGCDSLITRLTVSVMSPSKTSYTASICRGKTYTLPSGVVVSKPGVYTDTLKSVMGCDSLIRQTTLSYIPTPQFGITYANPFVCIGDSLLLTAFGGDAYQWYPAGTVESPNAASTYITPPATATYHVVITSNTCHVVDTQSVSIVVNPRPVVSVTKSNDVSCLLSSAKLEATGGVNYQWSPTNGLSDPSSSHPLAYPHTTTLYHVQVFSDAGCMSEDSIEVVANGGDVSKGYPVPNAFTPNHDGNNDCFGIKPSSWGDVTNFRLSVFTRNGLLMYSTTSTSGCWDGTYNGTIMPPDTYVYVVTGTSPCGYIVRKGPVILVR